MNGKKVLIVDEEAELRSSLCGLFGRLGCTANGVEGLARADDDGYDLIVLDADLASGDGIKNLNKVRRQHPKTPVILMVSCTAVSDLGKTVDLSVFDCIPKPVEPELLQLTARHALEKSQLIEEIDRLRDLLEEHYEPVPLRDVEKRHIERVLICAKWNQTHAAALLDVDRKTLRNKIKEFGLRKPDPQL